MSYRGDVDLEKKLAEWEQFYNYGRPHGAHQGRFGAAFAQLREKVGMAQSDIEGVSERQVRRIEKGETFPRVATLRRLADALSMDFAEFLREIGKV